jgi:hypothetical protein
MKIENSELGLRRRGIFCQALSSYKEHDKRHISETHFNTYNEELWAKKFAT